MLERLKGYRTVIAGALVTVASVMLILLEQVEIAGIDVRTYFGPYGPWAGVAVGLLKIYLRVITTGPVGKSEPS